MKLAIIRTRAGTKRTWPVITFPNVAPMDERNVIARDEATVILTG